MCGFFLWKETGRRGTHKNLLFIRKNKKRSYTKEKNKKIRRECMLLDSLINMTISTLFQLIHLLIIQLLIVYVIVFYGFKIILDALFTLCVKGIKYLWTQQVIPYIQKQKRLDLLSFRFKKRQTVK